MRKNTAVDTSTATKTFTSCEAISYFAFDGRENGHESACAAGAAPDSRGRRRAPDDSNPLQRRLPMELEEARQARTERLEEPTDRFELGAPLVEIHLSRRVQLLVRDVDPDDAQTARLWDP